MAGVSCRNRQRRCGWHHALATAFLATAFFAGAFTTDFLAVAVAATPVRPRIERYPWPLGGALALALVAWPLRRRSP